MLVLEGLVSLYRIIQLKLLQHYWSGHRLGLPWYWMLCLGNRDHSVVFETASNQSWIFIGRTDAEAEALMLWLPDAMNWFIEKDPDARKDWRQEVKGTIEDEMVGWHHWLNGYEFEQAPGDGEEQGRLSWFSLWDGKRVRHVWAMKNNKYMYHIFWHIYS